MFTSAPRARIFMKKQEKTFFIQNLTEELKDASSVVFINYSGLSVKKQQELKKLLRGVDAKMIVVKNTLLKIAGTDAKVPQESLSSDVLSGQTALVITQQDPISPLQILAKFSKEFETPQLKVGIIEGGFQDKESLIVLSKLPGKDALLSQSVGAIGAPLYGLIYSLSANMQKLIFLLNQKSQSG